MIECLRIDDRLLHGQVVTKWLTQYDPEAIVIADDKTVEDEIAKMALRMAKPEGVKMSIRSVEDAIELLNNDRTKKMRIFVLVKDTGSARKIAESVSDIKRVNIGGMRNNQEGAKVLLGVIKATPLDIENIRHINSYVDEIDVRTVPSDAKKNIMDFI